MDQEHRDANRRNWDERVPLHVASDFYDVEGFLRGLSHLRRFERAEIGELASKELVHLQCHIGLDTLSLAREGARVTGLDFSRPAIEAARSIAEQAQLEARFVVADVHDAATALGRRYDIVYTGLGALNWLPDMARWAAVVDELLQPGGALYLLEFHPFVETLDDEAPTVTRPYFSPDVSVEVMSGSYVDPDVETEHNTTYEWTHPISAVVGRLLERGLLLELFNEHDHTLYQRFPSLVHDPVSRTYSFEQGQPSLPLMYSLRMRKPART